MSPPLTEKEKAFINSLAMAIGKDMKAWVEIIGHTSKHKLNDIVKYLQEEHGLEYKMAHSLTHLYLENKGKNLPTIPVKGVGEKLFIEVSGLILNWIGNLAAGTVLPSSYLSMKNGKHRPAPRYRNGKRSLTLLVSWW